MTIDLTRGLLAGASMALIAGPALAAQPQTYRAHANPVLGTSFDMAVHGASETEALMAFAAARSEIARLDAVLSGWRSDSELAVLNRSNVHVASPDLFAVLKACETWREKTGGAYDTCAETAPGGALSLDAANRSVIRAHGAVVAPDGLAKGYIIDRALAAARQVAPCAAGMLIDIGGDSACYGAGEGGLGWLRGIADPQRQADNAPPALQVRLQNQALAVSGPGQRGEHLIDPTTKKPARAHQAAVIARTTSEADAVSTALAVLPAAQGLALAERLPGVEAAIFDADGGLSTTTGWTKFAQACQAPLPASFLVEIAYEVPKIDAANYKNPFIVVWVTDKDKNLVRTLAVSANRKNWIENEYVWWRRFGRNAPSMFEANQKATRPPGRYTVEWDGTDAAGKRAPQGQYTVHIEAAREHGGHSYQAIPITLGDAAANASVAGKDELGAVAVRYLKR